jgi:hypothetical protein
MRKLLSELGDDTIAAQRLRILQGINSTYLNFLWSIGKFFIDEKKNNDEVYLAEKSKILQEKWGNIFKVDNIKSTISFATLIPDEIHAAVLSSVISWKYLKVLLPLNDAELLMSFTKLCIDDNLSIEVLKESVSQIIASGEVPALPKVKRKKTKIDYLYASDTIEHGRKGEISVKSHEILIFSGNGQNLNDGIINNLFPDSDLEEFLKLDMSKSMLFDEKYEKS